MYFTQKEDSSMTLSQLQHFLYTAYYCNISRAAEELYVSHSTISRSITALEHEVGTKLLVRSSHGIHCTPAGELMKERAEEILASIDKLYLDIANLANSKVSEITIGYCSIDLPVFFDLINDFNNSQEQMHINICLMSPYEIRQALENGSITAALTFSYSCVQNPKYHFLPIDKGRFCVFASNTHPLASEPSITPKMLHDYHLFLPFKAAKRIFEKSTANTLSQNTINNTEKISLHEIGIYVKSGNAVALLPEHTIAHMPHGCKAIPLDVRRCSYEVGLYYPSAEEGEVFTRFLKALSQRLSND
jgi:DNA-binding transcriptional LysR family regulator